MIEARNVHKRFGHVVALDGVSLSVGEGEIVALIGPSGSGKSTLLRCINGLEAPDSGEVIVDGLRADHNMETIRKIRQRAGMVFQQYNLFPHLTAIQNLVISQRVVLDRDKMTAGKVATELLAKVGLSAKRDAYPSQLSGGQQQRVAIARALAMNPKVMLFDEPTSALDPEMTGEVLAAIQKLTAEGMTTLIVTHEIGFAREVADRVIFMDEGKIVAEGAAGPMLDQPAHPRLQAFLSKVLSTPG
ncbi:MAG: amino acid ABC transporter ATP-binding protein [bacterium]